MIPQTTKSPTAHPRDRGERWGGWRTEAAYMLDVAKLVAEIDWPVPRTLDDYDMPFCPLCSHDW